MKIKKFNENIDHKDIDPYGEENWGEEEKIIPNAPGVCHNCGSRNLDYGCSEVFDNQIAYEYDCDDCHFCGYEIYNLVFAGHEER